MKYEVENLEYTNAYRQNIYGVEALAIAPGGEVKFSLATDKPIKRIGIRGSYHISHGIAEIIVNGAVVGEIDYYRNVSRDEWQWDWIGDIPEAWGYFITIHDTGRKNTAATAAYVALDAISIDDGGSPVWPWLVGFGSLAAIAIGVAVIKKH